MPNWCSNLMYFSGEPAQIAEIKRLASGAVTPFYRRATNEGIRRKVSPGRPATAMPSVFWHRIARRWPLCPGRAVQPGSVSGWLNWS